MRPAVKNIAARLPCAAGVPALARRRHRDVLAIVMFHGVEDHPLSPPRALAITFDDGTRNLATHALPVLRELNLSAVVFPATGPIGTGATLWPDWL
jgi:peptidoglycan/xylan/chitin deacetylase (PgdA/CDA1 family)